MMILSHGKKNWMLSILIFVLPFVLLFKIIPFASDWTLGNDYPRYSIWNQMELMFCIKSGSFPLYAPGFAGGHSASALTLGELYHPLSHLASMMPGYWQGRALEWNTFFRLLTLGLSHLLLFSFLKRLNIRMVIALVLSMITVYNLRMLDLFRYGASLESWTGFIFLCSGIGIYYLEPAKKLWLAVIVGATYWLICSGHPQMAYFGLFGAAIFTLIIPSLGPQLAVSEDSARICRRQFNQKVFISILAGTLLAAAYIFPFYFDFLRLNSTRIAQEYGWADGFLDTFSGTINNFFYPLRSDVHGAFGGSLLYLAAALIPFLVFFQVKIPKVVWIIYGILALVFLYIQGARTPIHYMAWKFIPFASSFRIAGRISMIIPMLMLLLLLWIVKIGDRITICFLKNRIKLYPSSLLSYAALIVLAIVAALQLLLNSDMTEYSAVNIRGIPIYLEYVLLFSAIAAIIFFAVCGSLNRLSYVAEILFCVFSCLTLMGYLSQGTWIEKKQKTPTFQQIQSEKQERLDYRMQPGYGLISKVVQRQIEASFLEPFLGKIYCKSTCVEDNDSAYRYLARGRAADEIIIEKANSRLPILADTAAPKYPNEIRLVYAAFNKLVFNYRSNCSGFFGLAYPFTGHWLAKVDGKPEFAYRANGAAHAIRIPSGNHQIEFQYWSVASAWGILISLLTFVLTGCAFAHILLKKKLAGLLSFLIITTAIGSAWMWYYSLYHGDNLNTHYHWISKSLRTKPNLAYGKQAYFLSQGAGRWSLMSYGGLAVDGNYDPQTGFKSPLRMDPYWLVDLYGIHRIGSLVLYESLYGGQWNRRPLKISISRDGKDWHQAVEIEEKMSGQPIIKNFDKPESARYLIIKATGPSRLSFDEIEIFARD